MLHVALWEPEIPPNTGNIARLMLKEVGSIATITRHVTKRGDKVYLDYLQNRHGQLIVAPFSVRPLAGASVSMPIEWNAVITEQVPGEILAWRSRPGSMLENAGTVRFRPEGSGTRVDLRLCYSPPAGGAGQAVAELLGADPRAKLNEDLGRLKALLEGANRSETHGRESEP